jgi:FtsP/CotA-like multicopper oxidase with cupredoxin domain
MSEKFMAGAVSRRAILRWGAAGGAGVALAAAQGLGRPYLAQKGLLSADGAFAATAEALDAVLYSEVLPTSPLILRPFTDPLPRPKALAPVPESTYKLWRDPPGPGRGQQSSLRNQQHQIWPDRLRFANGAPYPDPIVYKIDLLVREHKFTTSNVLPIDNKGQPTVSFDAAGDPVLAGERSLPQSTIYGFNGTFPGPMINAEYGKPVLVRFENHLDANPLGLDRMDFGAPDWSFLTHLHNGHTAPESDGNPHYTMRFGPKSHGYAPGMWVDNMYLNWPAGGDDREKQSFFWFHDHRMDHTGSNVYKGMVGLYPIYDPKNGLDMGDERRGLRLPGVRTNYNPDGSLAAKDTSFFDVDYDIPLAFYDCRLDDGVTVHHDVHDGEFPANPNPDGTRPEWWGKSFFKHMPHKGFVGDILTVNGTAYPVLEVKRRKYRFRFLDASISRCYEFLLMSLPSNSVGPVTAASLGQKDDELQGQWRIPDGEQSMKFTQIASDGGLLPFAIERDSFELWPAKRREFVIDFTRYMDGTPTKKGDVIYLTNVMQMPDGLKMTSSSRLGPLDKQFQTPVMKIVIGDDAPDDSKIPAPMQQLRPLPPLPSNWRSMLEDRKVFKVERANNPNGELEWLVNGEVFDPAVVAMSAATGGARAQPALQKKNSFALWEIQTGGGWVHPFHNHMEEHRTVMRDGVDVTHPEPGHPDDASREDLTNLDPGESVVIYRGFRDFVGPYVSHCHNLAHEDHAMMFGWEITP